jgi:GlpG protein
MRQIGTLPDEQDAQRLAAYLVTQGIDAHAERDSTGWKIWVRDENRIAEAREEFVTFRDDPHAARYDGAEREAESIRRELVQQRLAAQKNVIEMRGRWKTAVVQRAPLTMTLMALSILVTLFGGFGKATEGFAGMINEELSFVSREDFRATPHPLASLAKGELWRAITPIFIHADFIHLAFNMSMFYQFGRLVEATRSTAWAGMAVLVIAVISNMSQGLAPDALGGSPFFMGMSGVVYGLFGYAWVKSKFDPQPGFYLSPVTVLILMGWLVLCMTPAIQNIANVAHVVGLVVGAAFAYLPILWKG